VCHIDGGVIYHASSVSCSTCSGLLDEILVTDFSIIVDAEGLKLADDESEGAFRLAQYGPLHSLSTRVNEVLLRVQI
jgi:hypothetical protein